MLGTIYNRARETQIWLGPVVENTQLALDFLKYLARFRPSLQSIESGGGLDFMASIDVLRNLRHIVNQEAETLTPLGALLSTSWWKRSWVQQEVAQSNPHLVEFKMSEAIGLERRCRGAFCGCCR